MLLQEAHIVFEDVAFAYGEDGQQPALSKVDLAVQPGEFIALVGANGSGKSTVAKMVNALLTPQSGSVLTLGLDTSTNDDEVIFAIRSQAGLVLQNPDSQIVASIVADDVAFGPENLAVPHLQIVERVDEALDAVKMSDYSQANPAHLSGGQKQRICIAGLLAMQPRVLVLDEPGAMLDARGRRGVRRVLGELNAAGLTVVLVTHFMEEAALAQRVVVMSAGEVVLDGSPRQVFAQGQMLRSLGLDVPFSVQLAHALRERGLAVPDIASPRELREILGCKTKGDGRLFENSSESVIPANALYQGTVSLDTLCQGTACQEIRSPDTLSPDTAQQPDTTTAQALSLQNISYCYHTSNTAEGGRPALNKVSLSLASGELLGIIGHTGSGKTTLLRIIAGLIKATSGEAMVAGINLGKGRKRPALHAKVGMVFQYPERQLFAPTVAEDIAFGPLNAGLCQGDAEDCVRKAMQSVELDYGHYASRSPFELSGGEKRRVAIAGVIATEPDVLIFDEPTAGLDVRGQNSVRALIGSLQAQGKTIILTSHSLDAIAVLASKVAVLSNGELVMYGSPTEVFCRANTATLKRINLGLPQTAEFARELSETGLELPENIFTVEELAKAIVSSLHDKSGGDNHGA